MEPSTWIDARNLACPLPIVHLARAVRALAPGTRVGLQATDEGITADLPAWCAATGNTLVSLEQREGIFRAVIALR